MKLVLGDYMKIAFGEGDFSVQEMKQDSSPIYKVFPNSRFGGEGRAVHTWWGQQGK